MDLYWESAEEFEADVGPIFAKSHAVRRLRQEPRSAHLEQFFSAYLAMGHACSGLRRLVDSAESQDNRPFDDNQAFTICNTLVSEVERMMLYCRSVGRGEDGRRFVMDKDFVERDEWERIRTGATGGVLPYVRRLVEAAERLRDSVSAMVRDGEGSLLDGSKLPGEFTADFKAARDLISVGFEDEATFMAGRGLEAVLREFARKKEVSIRKDGKCEQAEDATLHDLIECLSRVRWARDNRRALKKDTAALLHYLRELRNSTAHPSIRKTLHCREVVRIACLEASSLWTDASRPRARLRSKVIQKDWSR